MIGRILLDPTADAGGEPVVTPPAPVFEVRQPPAPAIDPARYQAEREELERLRAADADRARIAREAEESKLREKGKYEEIIKGREADIAAAKAEAERERQARAADLKMTEQFVVGKELNAALAARTDLADGAASKVARLIADDLVASQSGGAWAASTRDGKTVADHVRAYLAQPENALFLKATSRGGAGAAASTPAPSAALPGDRPASLGEAMLSRNANSGVGGVAFAAKYRTN